MRAFLLTNDVLTVRCASSQLPPSLVTVTLCENQLAHLSRLEQLTVSANPCLAQPDQLEAQYDYRPYVINWCLGLRMLDSLPVGAKESLKVRIISFKISAALLHNRWINRQQF